MGTFPGTKSCGEIARWWRRDPIWWRRGVIDIATMRIGDHQRCVLAQGYAFRAEPPPGDPSCEPDPWLTGFRDLGIPVDQAADFGFAARTPMKPARRAPCERCISLAA
jgi:hypothetical protein